MSELFPPSKPFESSYLQVSELHSLYYEQCGNPQGIPVVVLHGGPGGGCTEGMRQYFDPQKYRVVLFDQRGCGRSRPLSELRENDTWSLVEDIEKLRQHLDIEAWAVFGGSWGSTLALSYASRYGEKITKLFLRGIFTLREEEIRWFYQKGASEIFPDAWESYIEPIASEERSNLVSAYYRKLTGEDREARRDAARAWSVWEASTSRLVAEQADCARFAEDQFADVFARIECHYFKNKGFFPEDGYLIQQVRKYRHIPAFIVHGRYDVVCPARTAWDLHRAWPEAEFVIVPDAGHSLAEAGITAAMLKALADWQ